MVISDEKKFIKRVIDSRVKKYGLESLYLACDKMFPNKWDLSYDIEAKYDNWKDEPLVHILNTNNNKFILNITLYYPEIEITDGKLKHTITDLYVTIQFILYKNGGYYVYLIGTRSSYTLSELKNNYCHSHLPRIDITSNGTGFCLGRGPLNLYIKYTNDIRTEEEWLYILTLINQYVRWESIAGRPYNRISDLGTFGELTTVPDYAIQQIFKDYKFRNIKYKITDSSIEVIPSESLEAEITNLLKDTKYNTYLCYKNNDGEYLSQEQADINSPKLKRIINQYKDMPLFTFKGELLKLKILNERTDEQHNFTINAPNPRLTEGICKYLSENLTKTYLKRSRIKSEDSSKSIQECSRENEISLLSFT